MVEIKELIVKANEQCKRIKDYITENESMFDSMNLKLHYASYYGDEDMKKDFPLCYENNDEYSENSYFNKFCYSTYWDFVDWCAAKKINFEAMCHHIGRTSSFYLYEKELVEWKGSTINWEYTMYNILNELGCSNYSDVLEFDSEGNINKEKSFKHNEDYYTKEEWLKSALQYIIDEMYNDFIEEIEYVKKVYEYIKDIKDNQVEYFKEFLKEFEADLQDEKDKRDKEMAKRKEIISKMPEKIHTIMNRSTLNSDDLNVVLGCMS